MTYVLFFCFAVCFFCNNQHRYTQTVENLECVFQSRLRNAGKMIAMLDTWQDPTYLRRIWCNTAASNAVPSAHDILLTPQVYLNNIRRTSWQSL